VKEEGIHHDFLATPIRLIGNEQGHVRQIEMQGMKSKPQHQSKQRLSSRVLIQILGSNFLIPAVTNCKDYDISRYMIHRR
jgi:NADPH-dependent glutamate synthase beta subunit-like oxidoreductase